MSLYGKSLAQGSLVSTVPLEFVLWSRMDCAGDMDCSVWRGGYARWVLAVLGFHDGDGFS